MPSTHLSSTFHIVFSTKERRRLISAEWRPRLHAYLGGDCYWDGCRSSCHRRHRRSCAFVGQSEINDYFVRDMKADSSAWIHKEITKMFEWQKGYGAFSVGRGERDIVRRYIDNQEAHHRAETFEQEYVRLLQENDVEYDEKYLW